MLIVNPWRWFDEDGQFLFDKPHLYRRMLRLARFIEYGEPLKKSKTRETLIECKRRPKGTPCKSLMWVVKTEDDGILTNASSVLHARQQETEWAEGMMEAVPVLVDTPGPVRH